MPMSTPHPTCPRCAAELDVDYLAHGIFTELARRNADAEPDGWATVVGGEVVEVFATRYAAADLAEWLVAQGGAQTATVQPYSPEGNYLADDHGC